MTDKLLENYLQQIHEQDEPFPEGSIMSKVFVALGFGLPKHRKFRTYMKQYEKCVEQCNRHYEEEREVYKSNRDMFNQMDEPNKVDKRDTKETESMSDELVKSNPEKAKCITRCRITMLRSIVDLMEKEGDKICEKNKMGETCKEWVNKNLPELKVELEYLENAVDKLDRVNDDKKLGRLLGRVNQNLFGRR